MDSENKTMRYTKKRVLVRVFIVWCILFFVFICIPTLKPLESTVVSYIILFIILPGSLIAILVGDSNGWYLMHAHPLVLILLVCIVYLSSPLVYLWIAHFIISRMERYSLNSKTNNGDIITLFGSTNQPESAEYPGADR